MLRRPQVQEKIQAFNNCLTDALSFAGCNNQNILDNHSKY